MPIIIKYQENVSLYKVLYALNLKYAESKASQFVPKIEYITKLCSRILWANKSEHRAQIIILKTQK